MFESIITQEVQEADPKQHESAADAFLAAGQHLIAANSMEKASAAHAVNGNADESRKASDKAYNLRKYGRMTGQDRRVSSY